ncbi:MAG TPA: Hsp20/alpha crystallin family protein [Terriglobia bacterium]|nr:Hsp20/alpha crystallin family protein [Terriglobia bacterium]
MFSLMRRSERLPTLFGRRELPLASLREEMEELFERMMGNWMIPWERLEEPFPVKWETEELEKEYVLRVEAPGFETGEIEVSVAGDVLTVKAEHKEEEKEKNGAKKERRETRSFRRSMTLPTGTEPEKVEARYHNGVLEIHVPRRPVPEAKRIAIKT